MGGEPRPPELQHGDLQGQDGRRPGTDPPVLLHRLPGDEARLQRRGGSPVHVRPAPRPVHWHRQGHSPAELPVRQIQDCQALPLPGPPQIHPRRHPHHPLRRPPQPHGRGRHH